MTAFRRRTFMSVAAAAAIAAFVAGAAAPAAIAEEHEGGGGPSTPGASVVAVDPGRAGDIRMTLTARVDADAEPSAALRLWIDGTRIVDYDVHRVAVGDTSCGGGGEETEGEEHEGVRAVVRGVGELDEAAFGLADGAAVQVWIDLRDNGGEPYADDARIRLRPAPHGGEGEDVQALEEHEDGCGGGGSGGWTYDSRWQSIQLVHATIRPGLAP